MLWVLLELRGQLWSSRSDGSDFLCWVTPGKKLEG